MDITPNKKVLELRDLSIDYLVRRERVSAVKNISLTLRSGEGYALLGGSGAGKSTVALACLGYLPDNAVVTKGQVLFCGDDITGLPRSAMRMLWGKRVSLVPQDPNAALNPSRLIGKQIADVVRAHSSLSDAGVREKVRALLELVRLNDVDRVIDSYPHQLSGGMKQRVCIARALAIEPEMLVLDEPTTALDVTTQASILETICDIRDRLQVALLYITHDLRVVSSVCQHIGVMDQGEMVESGPASTILTTPRHPFTQALVSAAYEITQDDGTARSLARAAPKQTPLLEIRSLEKYFHTGSLLGQHRTIQAVADVTLTVRAGKTTALVGESGSGKSTVGACIMGMIPPTSGTIMLDGAPLAGFSTGRSREQRRDMAIVFQNPNASLNPSHTVRRIIQRALPPEKRTTQEVERLLESVQLDPVLAGRLPRELSGGQKQRVAIARAFASNPRLIVLDEATSSLDLTVQFAVLETLKRLQDKYGTAYLFISHDMHVVNYLADDVAIMYRGHICEQGPAEQIFDTPMHEYTRTLLNSAGGHTLTPSMPD